MGGKTGWGNGVVGRGAKEIKNMKRGWEWEQMRGKECEEERGRVIWRQWSKSK